MHNNHSITGDLTGIFLMVGNWTSIYLSIHPMATEWLQLIGLAFGVIASGVVIVDHCMKITWKVKQIKRSKRERAEHDSDKAEESFKANKQTK